MTRFLNKKFSTFVAAILIAVTVLSAFSSTAEAASWKVEKLKAAQKYSQLIIVSGYNKTHATVSMYTRKGKKWKKNFSVHGRVGRHGIGTASEDKCVTPSGIYSLHTAFGIKKNPGSKRPYTKVTKKHYWSAETNRLQRGYARGEHLISAGRAYNYAISLSYNSEAKKGEGYAFFLHCFGRRGVKGATGGCVSIPQSKMKYVLRHLRKDTRVIIDYSGKIRNY